MTPKVERVRTQKSKSLKIVKNELELRKLRPFRIKRVRIQKSKSLKIVKN
jgi:hypothetical protein